MFIEINDKSVVKRADFLKEIGPLYDLLIYLLDNSMRIATSAQIRVKNKQREFFAKQENVLSNAEMLL